MGCFTKAAALLSLSLATAFVIPDSPSSSIPSSSIPSSIPQLEYRRFPRPSRRINFVSNMICPRSLGQFTQI